MAVPEIKVPSVQSDSMPVAQPERPPMGAFGGAQVGQALTQTGHQLFGVGMEAYRRAEETLAQDKETEFQTRALKIRNQYRTLQNFDAISAHEKATAELEKSRQEIGDTIGSKRAHGIFSNHSLRDARYVQESIDSHFESQNKSYQERVYINRQAGDTDLLASMAQDDTYNRKAVDSVVRLMHGRAADHAIDKGFAVEEAKQFADQEVQKGLNAHFAILSHKGNLNRDITVEQVKKYEAEGWIDKKAAGDALNTLSAANVKSWARQQFVGLTRVDGNHEPDPEGFVPSSEVQKLKDAIPNDDPRKGEKVDALDHEYKVHQQAYNDVGFELRREVMTQGLAAGGGKFMVPKDSLDWQKFQRLYGDLASTIAAKAADRDYQAWHRGRITMHEASREAAGAARLYLDRLSSEDVKLVSSAQVEKILADSYHGPGMEPAPEDKARVLEYLKKLQTGKADPIEKQFGQISSQALAQAYKGNRQLVQAAMNRAYFFLDDTYSDSVRKGKPKTAAELREDLVKEFSKQDGIFGFKMWGRPGEKYERKGPPQVFKPGSADWKALKPGTRFRMEDDPPNKWRTR